MSGQTEPKEMPVEEQLRNAKVLLFEMGRLLRNTDKHSPLCYGLRAMLLLERCQRQYPREYIREVADFES